VSAQPDEVRWHPPGGLTGTPAGSRCGTRVRDLPTDRCRTPVPSTAAATARARSVVLGLALGVAPLLLLDLAVQLSRAAEASTAWWTIAAYALIGAVTAAAIVHARRDPLIPAVAAVVLLVAVAPSLPDPLAGLPRIPLLGDAAAAERPVIVVLAAACAVGAVRGRR
jgi:hypothetical protein